MENYQPQNNIPAGKLTVWETNPRLKTLLLALIFVFLASGFGLIALIQVQNSYRQKLYEETEKSLPKHLVGAGRQDECQVLPAEISSSPVFKKWVAEEGLVGSAFCGQKQETLTFDLPGETYIQTPAACQREPYPGKLFTAPDGKRNICMGSFGEPDSQVILLSANAAESGRLRFCGTVCTFNSGFWLDSNRFVLMETDNLDGSRYDFLLQEFDFKNKTQQSWKVYYSIELPDGRLRVDSPKDGDVVGNAFTVAGYAQNWFEGNIVIKVFDSAGKQLYMGTATAGNNYGRPAPFSSDITLTAKPTTAEGWVEFDDYSAKDGELVYQKKVNIKFSNLDGMIWKTYRNEQYGFEFQYPDNWTQQTQGFDDTKRYISFIPKDQVGKDYPSPSYFVMVVDTPEQSFDSWFSKYFQGHTTKPTKQAYKLNGSIDAWKISDPETIGGCAGEMIYIYKQSSVIMLPDPACEKLPIISQISGSFKISSVNAGNQVCATVITRAKNTRTGEVKDFPTACLPDGWERVQ